MHTPDPDLSTLRHIHILGICGTAMGAFAGLLVDLGYTVTGSDANVYPPMSTQLEGLGIVVREGYAAENLSPRPDLVIIGNVISRSNPEAEAVLALDLPYLSMPEALGSLFLATRTSLVVAGTHGKTTTSSLLAWCLHHAGRDPSFLIGGQLQNFGRNARLGRGQAFVVEGDEYDTAFFDKGPKFLHYRPSHAIVTSVEFDHADIYRDLAHVQQSFRRLLEILPETALCLACSDYPALTALLPYAQGTVQTYGLTGSPRWSGRVTQTRADGMDLTVTRDGAPLLDLTVGLTGDHNLLNVIAVTALLLHEGLSGAEIQAGMASFKGIRRRQEVFAEVGGVTLIDDFAHHPTAVAVTIDAVRRRFAGRRLWAIFEPRSNTSRRNVFQELYPASFRGADEVLISEPPNVARIAVEERMDAARLAADVVALGGHARVGAGADAIVPLLCRELKAGDVVLIMSNGGFDGIYKKLPAALAERG